MKVTVHPVPRFEVEDLYPDIPVNAFVAKPLSSGKYGLFQKNIKYFPYIGGVPTLDRVSGFEFDTVEECRARCEFMARPTVVVQL